jgi:hypothetical protein
MAKLEEIKLKGLKELGLEPMTHSLKETLWRSILYGLFYAYICSWNRLLLSLDTFPHQLLDLLVQSCRTYGRASAGGLLTKRCAVPISISNTAQPDPD